MKKILVGLVAILLIVAGGVWYFLSFRLDGMIEQQIEEIGSRSFGTRVTVGAVETCHVVGEARRPKAAVGAFGDVVVAATEGVGEGQRGSVKVGEAQ